MNRKEFDLSGITPWHELGYTGKGIRIASLEGTDFSFSTDYIRCYFAIRYKRRAIMDMEVKP